MHQHQSTERGPPCFASLLRPRQASELMRAAQSGPVIVVNVQKKSYYTAGLRRHHAYTPHFSYEKATKSRISLVHLACSRSLNEHGFRIGVGKDEGELERALAMLWAELVLPVLEFLA